MKRNKYIKRIIIVLLLVAIMVNYALPFVSYAKDDEHQVVRVGWYDSSLCYYDEFGRRCGGDYEYLQRISAYTGWTYEYVEDSWPNLFQKLKDGEIDILGDVSYKPEREDYMLFPDLPMGTEAYYIYVSINNSDISSKDITSLKGKRIGVNKDSIQKTFLEDWSDKNDVDIEIVELVSDDSESLAMIESGEIDGYANIYSHDSGDKLIPVCRIGGSDYYYAVNKDREDLLQELNIALTEIQDSDPYYNQKLSEERLYGQRSKIILTQDERDWVISHGAIRIGYREDYLPFCDTDDKTGELTGALKDYLVHAENVLEDSNVEFETVSFNTTEEALAALEAGDIDAVFPVYLSTYDADQRGIRLTESAMKTEMNSIMRTSDKLVLDSESDITLAVNEGMMNIETFIMDKYPNTKRESYKGLDECYKAVADGKADCVLVSNYRNITSESTLKDLKLYSVPTGESMPLSFALDKWDSDLYVILNKIALSTNSEEMDVALASYMMKDHKVSFKQFLNDNWLIVLIIIVVIFTIVIILLVQKMKAERTADKQRKLLDEAAVIADLKQTVSSLLDNMPGMNFTKDAETGEYLACNQAFALYANRKDPSEVIGHTSDELFDPETAKSCIEDDKMALSMDEPYVFFSDRTDHEGNTRQMKTTKQKYTDANGRLCVLGILQDVTDSFRISRDNAKTKESYEKARNSGVIFTHIAQTLAYGYLELYYIDINTEEFIEYRIDRNTGKLTELRRGWHFFEECMEEIDAHVYPEDKDIVSKALDRKTLVAELDKDGTFVMNIRLVINDVPKYVSMKINRMQDDDRFLILSLTDVDEQMKEHNAAQQALEEQVAYNRISALAGDFFCIYIIDPETGHYREFSSTTGFNTFDLPDEGEDFFADYRLQALAMVYQEDQSRFLSMLTRQNVLSEVEKSGIFTLSYRLTTDGEPRYVQLKAAMLEEKEGHRLIVGVNDIDSQVRQEEEYSRRLAQARIEANIDALTGVKNRNAYRVYEDRINAQIEINRAPEFAITILDLNDLKKVNDTQGHKAGDQYLRDACKIICTTFKRSPVFRVGGDEFAVLSQGDDYNRIDELVEQMNNHNEEAVRNGGIVIALGMARYENESKVAPVYERADKLMYENKSYLKSKNNKED